MSLTGIVDREMRRISAGVTQDASDSVVVEEPLEIRVGNETVGVTMRTPGQDEILALGFLFGEGILDSSADVSEVAYCGRPTDEGFGNSIRVSLAAGSRGRMDRVLAGRRWNVTTSACGVCGRRSIDDLLARCPLLPKGPSVSERVIAQAVSRLRDLQPQFASTGGMHAAGAFDAYGTLIACFEDVGRHNAVDKVVGQLLRSGLVTASPQDRSRPGQPVFLVVSGRSSFEIVQKATTARIPIVASVSAASSLAIDLAQASGVTLAAFVRDGSLNVYANPERLVG